jgi:hypothetical protein
VPAPVSVPQYPAAGKPPSYTPLFPDAVRSTGIHILGAPGTGKSRLLGRRLLFDDYIRGVPQAAFDVTGGMIDNFLDKVNRIIPDYERRWWAQYRQPLPPDWIRYLEHEQKLLTERIIYVDMSGKLATMPFPLLYRLSAEESLYENAQRVIEVFAKLDPDLARAPVEGLNSLKRIGTNVLMILAALGLQITEAPELIYHPEWWSKRFAEALTAYPEVAPAIAAIKEFGKNKLEYRVRRSDSFLTKIDMFLKDPYQRAMFGAATLGIDWQQVIDKKQTVLLDFRKVEADQLRFSLLWVFLYLLTFLKQRDDADREAPFAICIDEFSVLVGLQAQHQALLTEDIRLLVEVIGRNYGCWITLAHQRLSQIEESSMVDLLMQMGTQCIGRATSPKEAEYLAEHFFRFDPHWIRKEEPVRMLLTPPPILTLLGESELPKLMVVDVHTTEYTVEEQRVLHSYSLRDLKKFHFLTKMPASEGDRAGEVQLLDFSRIDLEQYPDKHQLPEIRRRLAKRSGYSKEELLAQIEQRSLKVVKKKAVQAPKEDSKLSSSSTPTHDPTNDLPIPTEPAPAVPAIPKRARGTRKSHVEDVFQ